MEESNFPPYTSGELERSGVTNVLYERANVIHYKKDDGSIVVLHDLGNRVSVVIVKNNNVIKSDVIKKPTSSFEDIKKII